MGREGGMEGGRMGKDGLECVKYMFEMLSSLLLNSLQLSPIRSIRIFFTLLSPLISFSLFFSSPPVSHLRSQVGH